VHGVIIYRGDQIVKILTVFLALLGITTAPSWAQGVTTSITKIDGEVVHVEQSPKPVPEALNSFEETDSNQDGRLTQQEAYDAGILEFSAADVNNDGFLDADEYYKAANGLKTERSAN
jgi:hypothetical protein